VEESSAPIIEEPLWPGAGVTDGRKDVRPSRVGEFPPSRRQLYATDGGPQPDDGINMAVLREQIVYHEGRRMEVECGKVMK
jgi:hypothetical protein